VKLDVKHLDRLIAEELQTLFEAPLAAAPAATGSVPPAADDKGGLYGTGTAFPPLVDPDRDKPPQATIGAEKKPYKPPPHVRTATDYVATGVLGATPIIGGMMTAADIAADKEAGGVEKTVRHAANIAQEVIPTKKIAGLFKGAKAAKRAARGTKIGHGTTAGATIASGGSDPVDNFIKRSFQRLPGRKRTPEAEKKHQAQQKQAKAAQDPTARSAARDGLTAAELDARNKKRLAARGMGGPTSAKDAAAQKAWVASDPQLQRRVATKRAQQAAARKKGYKGLGGQGQVSMPGGAESQAGRVLHRESVRTNNNMLTENQIKRFQKLANCRSPQKRLITEAMDPLSIIGIILGVLVIERVRTAYEKTILEPLWGTEPEEEADPWADAPMATTIKFVWNKLKDVATSRSQKGDSSLESTLNTLESSAERNIDRLSPESIAAIQKEFGDDEQLAALLGQLGEVQEEDYREVLSQVEDHIASKLGI